MTLDLVIYLFIVLVAGGIVLLVKENVKHD